MRRNHIIFAIAAVGLLVLGAGASSFYHHHSHQQSYEMMHQKHHGNMDKKNRQHEGHKSHQHDEVNMPGLNGKDTNDQEVSDLKTIFQKHKAITRTVTPLPNGIRTVTESETEEVRDAIISHVSMMVTRLQEGRNPEVVIQSPTLDRLFDVYDQIETETELTDTGIAVIQTSTNPEVVQLLQTHAAEVTDMSERGMAAVHERMMATGTNHH